MMDGVLLANRNCNKYNKRKHISRQVYNFERNGSVNRDLASFGDSLHTLALARLGRDERNSKQRASYELRWQYNQNNR